MGILGPLRGWPKNQKIGERGAYKWGKSYLALEAWYTTIVLYHLRQTSFTN